MAYSPPLPWLSAQGMPLRSLVWPPPHAGLVHVHLCPVKPWPWPCHPINCVRLVCWGWPPGAGSGSQPSLESLRHVCQEVLGRVFHRSWVQGREQLWEPEQAEPTRSSTEGQLMNRILETGWDAGAQRLRPPEAAQSMQRHGPQTGVHGT